jgi:hypothetical protein
MKPILIAILFMAYADLLTGQNSVGINTTTPEATLDVRGGLKLGSISKNIQFDTLSGTMRFVGSAIFAPTLQKFISSSSNGGLYVGPSQLQFRSGSKTEFSVNINSVTVARNLGIGMDTPLVPLHVALAPLGLHPFDFTMVSVFESPFDTYINLLSPPGYATGLVFGNLSTGSDGTGGNGAIVYGGLQFPNGFQFRTNNRITRMVLDDAGHLGIGTTTPNAPLGFPPAFGKKITLYPAATGDVGLAVQGNLLQMYADNPNADIAFGYDQAGTMTERMRIKGNGNIGIGTSTPFSPLTFSNGLGEKVSLYGNATNNYGFGVQASTLQIHSDAVGADVAFGYGSSTSFTEVMRIKGNGNVGIGISNPNAPLTFPPGFGKKITLYPAATGDVGLGVQGNLLQLFADNPNADIAFGYDQAGTFTERMRIKGNGSLAMNGNTGTAGQVLQSNGSTASPTWVSSTNALYNNTFIVSATPVVTTVIPPNSALIPGLTSTFSLAGNAKVMVQFNVIATTTCSNCFAEAYINVMIDGNQVKLFSWRILNESFLSLTGSHLLSLAPGSHTISLYGGAGQNTLQFGFNSSLSDWRDTMIIQIIPQ